MSYRIKNEEKSDDYYTWYDVFNDENEPAGYDQEPTQLWYDEHPPQDPLPDTDGDGVPDIADADPNDPAVQ
jgi:hypothetical protein